MRIEGYFRERQLACLQVRHRIFQPHAADIALRRDTHGECEFARKMKLAKASNSGDSLKGDIVLEVCRNIIENALEPSAVEAGL